MHAIVPIFEFICLTCPLLGLEPGLLNLEWSALTMRSHKAFRATLTFFLISRVILQPKVASYPANQNLIIKNGFYCAIFEI